MFWQYRYPYQKVVYHWLLISACGIKKAPLHEYCVQRNFCASLFLRISDFFCVLRELIFLRLGQIGFSCWELIFAIFRKYQLPSIDNMFVLIEYVQQQNYIISNNTTVQCAVSISLYTALFSERKRQVVIEQIWFRSTVFLSSEFKEENIYSGVSFCGKIFAVIFICGYLFLRIGGKSQKLEPAKISCHTVFETLWKHHLLQSYENILKTSKSCSVMSQKINNQG